MLTSGYGEFFSFEKKDIGSDNLHLKRIKSNIKNFNGLINNFSSKDSGTYIDFKLK